MELPQDHPIMHQCWFEKLQNITNIHHFELFAASTNLDIEKVKKKLVDKHLINKMMLDRDQNVLDKLQKRLHEANEQPKKEEVKIQKIKKKKYAPKTERGALQKTKRNRNVTKKSNFTNFTNLLEETKAIIQKEVDELLKQTKKYKENNENVAALQTELEKYSEVVEKHLQDKKRSLLGLTPARIQQFHQFEADESLAGDLCSICQDDIEVGRRMIRLDCHHVFCQDCVKGWLADHHTCPNCRHVFNRT